MNKLIIAAAAASIATFASPVAAQSAQERLDVRYNQALAAGYKALFLCSAIANAEANGTTRTPESVHEWELTGVNGRYDDFIRDMPYEIVRRPTGQIAHVQVEWADDMPDRVAMYFGTSTGCSILPIGTPEDYSDPETGIPLPERGETETPSTLAADGPGDPDGFFSLTSLSGVLSHGLDSSDYGEGRTTAIVVRKVTDGGDRVEDIAQYAEGFGPNTPQRTWSVAKSIASTFVGMATLSQQHSVEDPVNINYWRVGPTDQRARITIDNALRMASGRYSDTPGNRTEPIYWGGSTVDERATHWPMIYQPGTVYRYSNNDTLMAVKGIEQYIGFYGVDNMIRRIGMDHTYIETDSRGGAVLSSQVWTTAEDLANLGQLYLQDGVWKGERLLPEGWVDYVSDPSGPQPQGTNWGYGAGWWTFRRPEGNAFEGIPDDAFAARGNRGQYVVVVPSRNVVIVRRGEDMVGTRFDIASFTRDVLAALQD
ncbi:MAG: serine hydrolase [Pseudomonadota bacterium]